MPEQTITGRLDEATGFWPIEYVSKPWGGYGSWMTRNVTFCGIKKSLRQWIRESGLRSETVRGRLTRGMDPAQALITPDYAGHCLKPLPVEYLESARKAEQRAMSGVHSFSRAGTTIHGAGIVAHGKKIFLGTFQTREEAVFAFNRAVDLLPGEYDPTDKYEDVDLDLLNRVRIENAVRELFEAAGLKGDLESECGDE